jgi:hypothetical protein
MSLHRRATSQTSQRRNRARAMAIDTRPARSRSRRRERSSEPAADWRDGLIPAGVVAVLGGIVCYHHAVVSELVSRIL